MRSVQGSAVLCRRCGECAPLHNGNNSFSFAHQIDEMRIRELEKKKEKRVIDQRLKRRRWQKPKSEWADAAVVAMKGVKVDVCVVVASCLTHDTRLADSIRRVDQQQHQRQH